MTQVFFSKLKKIERIDSFLLRDKFKRIYAAVGQNHVYLTSGYSANLNFIGFQFCLYLICIHFFVKYLFFGIYGYITFRIELYKRFRIE